MSRCIICDKLSHPDNPVVAFTHPKLGHTEDLCRECLEECYPWTADPEAPETLWEALLEADSLGGTLGSQEFDMPASDEIYPLSVDSTKDTP
jgi:hypothetical protein